MSEHMSWRPLSYCSCSSSLLTVIYYLPLYLCMLLRLCSIIRPLVLRTFCFIPVRTLFLRTPQGNNWLSVQLIAVTVECHFSCMGHSLQRTERNSHRGEISWIIHFVYQPVAAPSCSCTPATNIDLTDIKRHLDSSEETEKIRKEWWHGKDRELARV